MVGSGTCLIQKLNKGKDEMEVALGSMVFIRSWGGGGDGDGKESYTEMD